MNLRSLRNGAWRPLAIGTAAIVCLAILFSFAPVRQVAADFLGLFRVRKFAVIPLDPTQAQRLEGLAQQAETVLGQPTVLREQGPEQPVADAAQASALAGFPVRMPAALPENAQQTKFVVQTGAAVRFEVQRTVLETLMQAAGVSTAGLPQMEKISATVDVPAGVMIEYRGGTATMSLNGAGYMHLLQLPSPQVDVPEGVDLVALSETGFQFLGIPADEAHRLATTIDWTSTLVIPLPTNIAQAQEVSIDGTTGLLIESGSGDHNPNTETALLWERDGILYVLSTRNLDRKELLRVADSLR